MIATPTSPAGTSNEPRDLRIAVIGAGMAGILSGVKLLEAGITDFTIYEKGDGPGGTWRENTYPGLACDVPSHLYSYSFAPNPEWSHRFSPGPEIRTYFAGVARDHGLDRYTRYREGIVSCRFTAGRWQLETERGTHDEVDVVIAATGVLHHPRYPDIQGRDTFAGAMFHSARWDHDARIDGARVGVIGTGSTAVQITSAIVDRVAHLSLFQRTAQWIMPQENPPYTDEQKEAYRRRPAPARGDARAPRASSSACSPRRWWTRTRRRSKWSRTCASPTSSRASPIPNCASGCAPTTAPRASVSSCRRTSTRRSSGPTPSS